MPDEAYLGYRIFRAISVPGEQGQFYLSSAWKGGISSWDQDSLFARAKCLSSAYNHIRISRAKLACFQSTCECGLHAWDSAQMAWEKRLDAMGPNPNTVLAASAHWGTVENHDYGLRSQKAMVLALFYPEHWSESQFSSPLLGGLMDFTKERDVPLLPSITDFYDPEYATEWAHQRNCVPYSEKARALREANRDESRWD